MYQNRWALITGASSGLGAAYAEALMERGAHLILVARREDRLQALAEKAKERGVKALVFPTDLSDPEAPRQLMGQIKAANAPVDILINNAGFGLPGSYAQTSWADQNYFLQLMVTAYAELAHYVLPPMIEKDWGRIINVASLAGITPGASGHTLYGASKAFLINFSQSLAAETHGTGVKASAFCPGFTLTEFHDRNHTRDQISALPKFMVKDAREVVEGSLNAVERDKTVYVPGAWNKFIAFLARILPMGIAEELIRRQSASYRRTRPLSEGEESSSGKTTTN